MLTQIIRFEKGDYSTGVFEEFIVDNTVDNWELILSDRFTRNIKADQMQDFQFAREMNMPAEYVDMSIWVALLPEIKSALSQKGE